MKKIYLLLIVILAAFQVRATNILIPMDHAQKNHLKAYGIAYWLLENNLEIDWLLNYRGGSFMVQHVKTIEEELIIRGVSFEVIADAKASAIVQEISDPEINMEIVKLEKAPKIAVYSPKNKQPWDDAVTLVLTYAEIPYEVVYDEEIIGEKLPLYDWLHLHHEDFTGQYGKFYFAYKDQPWYKEQVRYNEEMAAHLGFNKVSELKLAVAKKIKDFTVGGGFLFAMCSGTDALDIALAAEGLDICEAMFDGDGTTPNYNSKLDYSKTFAFKDFTLKTNPLEYEFSTIDATNPTHVRTPQKLDNFTLFDFSAKWDIVPSMLCQNHETLIDGFFGQTTSYNKQYLKSNVVVMGENKSLGIARYIHGEKGKAFLLFMVGMTLKIINIK